MSRVRYNSLEMIERLISFNTVSSESNLDLIAFVETFLGAYGIASQRVMSDDGRKANLFATLGDPALAGGIVLSGHTDVVPVEGQDWSSDPFTLVQHEGRLYGRGTCDMKSFIAIALALVPDYAERGLKVPVHFALSYDEEVGCLGVRPMIDEVIRSLPRPQIVIVGEPTDMKVVNAHKSIQAFRTEVIGLEAHSSATDAGVNAVVYAADLIMELDRIAAEMRQAGDASGRFRPPYTTVHVGPIRGGTALNIIPKRCSFQWEIRGLPDLDPDILPARFQSYVDEAVLPRMRAVYPDAQVITTARARVPGLMMTDGSPGESLVLKLAERNQAEAVSYGTEAGLFQLADIPTVVCGPGNILQAHKPDEYVELSQVALCERFLRRLFDYAASGQAV